jgi:hypothetical protein
MKCKTLETCYYVTEGDPELKYGYCLDGSKILDLSGNLVSDVHTWDINTLNHELEVTPRVFNDGVLITVLPRRDAPLSKLEQAIAAGTKIEFFHDGVTDEAITLPADIEKRIAPGTYFTSDDSPVVEEARDDSTRDA